MNFTYKVYEPASDNSLNRLKSDYFSIVLGWNANSYDMVKLLTKRGVKTAVVTAIEDGLDSKLASRINKDEGYVEIGNQLIDYINSTLFQGDKGVVISSEDVFTMLLSMADKELDGRFSARIVPKDLIRKCTDKIEFCSLCEDFGIDLPKTFVIDSAEYFEEVRSSISYPGIVKQHRFGAIPKTIIPKVLKIENESDLIKICDKIWGIGLPVFYQEFIPGGSEQTWFVGGLFKQPFNLSNFFIGQKIFEHPLIGGSTTYAKLSWNQEVLNVARKFVEKTQFVGMADIEFKYDVRDGKYKIIEVNPRIGRWHSISDNGEVDVVTLFFADKAGLELEHSELHVDDRSWINPYLALCGFIEKYGILVGSIGWLRALVTADIRVGVDLKDRERTIHQLRVVLGHIREIGFKKALLGSSSIH